MMNGDAWAQTVRVAKEGAIITHDPAAGAHRTDLALAARGPIICDCFGNNFVKQTITLTPGGN
jgi:fructosamine-3-kinase